MRITDSADDTARTRQCGDVGERLDHEPRDQMLVARLQATMTVAPSRTASGCAPRYGCVGADAGVADDDTLSP